MTELLQGKRLEDLLSRLPTKPGVYLMRNTRDQLLYVGKAKSLRTRVRSYFRASGDERPFIAWMNQELGDIQVVVTPSEKDALILERELIAKHHPRYNIDLRDDKNFLSIRITHHRFARLLLDRKRPHAQNEKDPGLWFGPYTSAAHTRQTVRTIQQLFGLRTCSDSVFSQRSRPCLLFQMDRCSAPCCDRISVQEYCAKTQQTVAFLRGQSDQVLAELSQKMDQAASQLRYEEAAQLRDRIQAIQATVQKRQVIDQNVQDVDVLGLYREGAGGNISLLQIRQGRWLNAGRYPFRGLSMRTDDIIRQFVAQHYAPGADLPDTIYLPEEASQEDLVSLSQLLSQRRQKKVALQTPKRGSKLSLLQMAHENAREAFVARLATTRTLHDRLLRLQHRLGLARVPIRIECFDLSTSAGRSSVGSMAVLLHGEPHKSAYRRYRIRSAQADSDVDMMREVVSRRFQKCIENKEEGPDLVVLDGGRGQLNAIAALLADLGQNDVDLVALAKGGPGALRHRVDRERVFVPGRKNPIRLAKDSDELFLLSRVRDEAHRFAIRYHRKLRRKAATKSALDDIPGIGKQRKQRLLRHFGSLPNIRSADLSQLTEVPGISKDLALQIQAHLTQQTPQS